MEGVRLLAFDADDTLWDNQSHFDKAVEDYCSLLSCYGSMDQMYRELYSTECGNMDSLGYGTKAFIISLVENLIRVSGGKASNQMILDAVNIGRRILNNPATPLEGVKETLQALKGKYRMVIFTKGDPLEQEAKIARSGLGEFFEDVEIVGNKTPMEYKRLCCHNGVKAEEFAMIGNSFKSDIAPVLEMGGNAILIPYGLLWEHERVEEYDHPNLIRLKHFSELTTVL
ncbi:MAG: HAD hydrolase-like protein [Bacteroidales bacterium]|nr:HAD hydrolase-like protein [Bacteroidales bacterium]